MLGTNSAPEKIIQEIEQSELKYTILREERYGWVGDISPQFKITDPRFAEEGNKVIKIFPLHYSSSIKTDRLSETRIKGIKLLFKKWTNAGYNKKNEKSPFKCIEFQKYLEDTGFNKADYLLAKME